MVSQRFERVRGASHLCPAGVPPAIVPIPSGPLNTVCIGMVQVTMFESGAAFADVGLRHWRPVRRREGEGEIE